MLNTACFRLLCILYKKKSSDVHGNNHTIGGGTKLASRLMIHLYR
jgi:hypothetical protein